MIRFVVDDDHEDGRAYEVRIYPNHRAYLAACRRRRPDERHAASQATTFNEWSIWFHPSGREIDSPLRGAIYLQADFLDGEILAHEATHAALNLYRARHRGAAALGRNQTDAEARKDEELCRSVGRITQAIADKLWEHGIWKRAERN